MIFTFLEAGLSIPFGLLSGISLKIIKKKILIRAMMFSKTRLSFVKNRGHRCFLSSVNALIEEIKKRNFTCNCMFSVMC